MPLHPTIQRLVDNIGQLEPQDIAVADQIETALLDGVRSTTGVELDTPEKVEAFMAGAIYVIGAFQLDPIGMFAAGGRTVAVSAVGAMASRLRWMDESAA